MLASSSYWVVSFRQSWTSVLGFRGRTSSKNFPFWKKRTCVGIVVSTASPARLTTHSIVVMLLDLPELRLERCELLPRRLGNVERSRVVSLLSGTDSLRLFIKHQSMRSRQGTERLTSLGSTRKLKTLSLEAFVSFACCSRSEGQYHPHS